MSSPRLFPLVLFSLFSCHKQPDDTEPASGETDIVETGVETAETAETGETGETDAPNNVAPTITNLVLSPNPAYADNLIEADVEASDADGDTVTLTYAWSIGSTVVQEGEENTLEGPFVKDSVVSVEVTPNDGFVDGISVSDSVTIKNSIPSVSDVAITWASGDPDLRAGDTVYCTGWTFTDTDSGDSDASTVVWTINTDYAGTGSTLEQEFVSGDLIECTVTPNDGEADGTPVSASVVVANTKPSVLSAWIDPDPAYEGDSLTCEHDDATDVDGAASFTYTITWTVVSGSDTETYTGETLSADDDDYFSFGDEITCTVVANDGEEDSDETTSDTLTISNTAPQITSDLVLNDGPHSRSNPPMLAEEPETVDADGHFVSVTYQWFILGDEPIEDATDMVLDPSFFAAGSTVFVRATPTDEEGAVGAAVDSELIEIENAAPHIENINDQTMNEDASSSAIPVIISDVDDATGTSLMLSGTSGNTALVLNSAIVFDGSGNNRTVTVTPVTDGHGEAVITVKVSDGTAEATESFTLTVTDVNELPVAEGQSVTTDEDTELDITLTGTDFEGAVSAEIVTGPTHGTLTGTAPDVTYTPDENYNGSDSFTFKVKDTVDAYSAEDATVSITVTPVNDVPTISSISNQTVDEDGATSALDFTVADVETAASTLIVTASSSDENVVPFDHIAIATTEEDGDYTVTVTPATNANNTSGVTITLTVSDGTSVDDQSTSFDVVVTPVNDAPTISSIEDKTIYEDRSTGEILFTVGDVETAAGSLTVTASTSDPTVIPLVNIELSGSGSDRIVTVRPAPDRNSTTGVTITLTVSDGTTSDDESTSFTVIVTPVADNSVIRVTGGGGVGSSANHTLTLTIGSPMTTPTTSNGQHTLTLGIGTQMLVPPMTE